MNRDEPIYREADVLLDKIEQYRRGLGIRINGRFPTPAELADLLDLRAKQLDSALLEVTALTLRRMIK